MVDIGLLCTTLHNANSLSRIYGRFFVYFTKKVVPWGRNGTFAAQGYVVKCSCMAFVVLQKYER